MSLLLICGVLALMVGFGVLVERVAGGPLVDESPTAAIDEPPMPCWRE